MVEFLYNFDFEKETDMRKNHYTMKARMAVKNSISHLDPNSSIGVGCSGGADSSAILFALSSMYRGSKASKIHVLIIDHQLQEITAEVSKNVAETALRLGFTPHIIPVSITTTNSGAESDARTARYEAFEKAADDYNLSAILIGHTKNDQAEQTFLGMLRGSGTRSLSGIRETRGIYHRPFLNSLSRADTQKVCEENNYDYWCDPHNDHLMYKRVGIRKMIKTVEETTGTSIVDPLVRTAQISAEDADALDFYTDMSYTSIESKNWDVKELSKIPTAVRKRIYRKKMSELGGKTDALTFEITNRIDDFIADWHGQKEVCVSNGIRVSRVNGKIVFES